mmetsp:Transcript_14405/g.54524  ORF Transcript_14405/g.54524 Transcript_14405/m.54524 type:complete len:203 (+) Transcript_14405:364-972(+)
MTATRPQSPPALLVPPPRARPVQPGRRQRTHPEASSESRAAQSGPSKAIAQTDPASRKQSPCFCSQSARARGGPSPPEGFERQTWRTDAGGRVAPRWPPRWPPRREGPAPPAPAASSRVSASLPAPPPWCGSWTRRPQPHPQPGGKSPGRAPPRPCSPWRRRWRPPPLRGPALPLPRPLVRLRLLPRSPRPLGATRRCLQPP